MAITSSLGYYSPLAGPKSVFVRQCYGKPMPIFILLNLGSRQIMAKEQQDRTTIDLFMNERRPGRPKTSQLHRQAQLRVNKRNQLKRDKNRGLKRVELKLTAEAVAKLNQLAENRGISRSDLIEEMLLKQLAHNET